MTPAPWWACLGRAFGPRARVGEGARGRRLTPSSSSSRALRGPASPPLPNRTYFGSGRATSRRWGGRPPRRRWPRCPGGGAGGRAFSPPPGTCGRLACPARPRCPRRRRMGPSHSSPPPSARRRPAAAAAAAAALAPVAAPLLLLPLLRSLMPLLPLLLLPLLLLMPVLLLPLPPLLLLPLRPPRRGGRSDGVALGPRRASGRGGRRERAIHRSIHRTHGNP